jgi:hypothetical protein
MVKKYILDLEEESIILTQTEIKPILQEYFYKYIERLSKKDSLLF